MTSSLEAAQFEYSATYIVPPRRRDDGLMEATVAIADRVDDRADPPSGDPVGAEVFELDRQRIRFDGYFTGPTW
ncbi:MAG TPA: hypothetical protein VE666_10390 [Mycobacterium sp.]|jgi:hypothetical protein|nr:hypothetical protein [Mycobacterium sp.]